MSIEMKLQFDREAIIQFSKQSAEPEWMLNLRLEGYDHYQQLPLPKLDKTKIDKWNMDGFVPFRTQPSVTAIQDLPEEVQKVLATEDKVEKAVLVQKDASVIYTSLPESLKSQGVVFTSLQAALATHGELIQKYFMQLDSKIDSHKISALHAAAWSGGVFLYIPKNVEVKVPVQAVFYASGNESGLIPHILIVTEANSSVDYIDNYMSEKDQSMIQNGIVEIHVGEGSRVNFTSVRTLNDQATDYIFRHASVEKDGRMEWLLAEMNDGNTVTQNTTHLEGNGSSAESKLITIGSGAQKTDVVSKMTHTGKNSDSQMLVKGVVKDEASAILNGITFIEKGATKANGEQAEKLLMLSPKARGDANPILLIDEDDVKAGHAASAGQINPMQIFYMMSRGIPKEEAQRLIIFGFLAQVVDAIPNKEIKKVLEAAIERKVY